MTTIKAQWPTTRAAPSRAAKPEPEPMPAATAEAEAVVAMGYQIANDPLPTQCAMPGKYAELFAHWPQGAAVRCAAREVPVIADALRRHLKRTNQPGKPRICSNYPGDSQTPGRVWWLAE